MHTLPSLSALSISAGDVDDESSRELPLLPKDLWDIVLSHAAVLTVKLIPSWYRGERVPRTIEVPMGHRPNTVAGTAVDVHFLWLTGVFFSMSSFDRTKKWEHSPVCDNAAFMMLPGPSWVAKPVRTRRFICPDAPWKREESNGVNTRPLATSSVIAISCEREAPTVFKMYTKTFDVLCKGASDVATLSTVNQGHADILRELTPSVVVNGPDHSSVRVKAALDSDGYIVKGPWSSWMYVAVWIEE